MKKKLAWGLVILNFLILLLALGTWIYSNTLRPPNPDMSRGILQKILKADTIEQNISNKSKLLDLGDDAFAVGYLEKGNLFFEFYDENLNKVNQLKTEFTGVKDFDIKVDGDNYVLYTLADGNIRKTIVESKNLKRIGKDIRIDEADFMVQKDGYLVYGKNDGLGVVEKDGKTYILKTQDKVINADIKVNDEGVKIVYATISDMTTHLRYAKYLNAAFSDYRDIAELGTDINRKLRSLVLEANQNQSTLIYGIKDHKSQNVAYYTVDIDKAEAKPVSVSSLHQDSAPVFYNGTSEMILLIDDVKGNSVYTQAAIADLNASEPKKLLTKGKITAYNPEMISINGHDYLKYENVMANKKEVYLASSSPSIMEKTSKPSVDEVNGILGETVAASVFGYAFSLSYFGYIFIFISLLFFSAMLFFVSWTERNPGKIIIAAAVMHLIAQLMTMSSYLIQNAPSNIALPFYLKNPVIVIAMIVISLLISLAFIFYRHTRNDMKQRLWGTYFEFFTVNTILYMLIFFPYLAVYYI